MKLERWNFLPLLTLLGGALGQLQFSGNGAVSDDKKNHKTNSGSPSLPDNEKVHQEIDIVPNSFGFVGSKVSDQNLIVRNGNTKNKVRLVRFQRQNPPHFGTAIGAISSQLAGQISQNPISQNRQRQEYVPYPPNGDFFNYPAYRGFSQRNEAPQPLPLAPYEILDNGNNYRTRSSVTLHPYASTGGGDNNDYPYGFPTVPGHQTFDPNFFLHGFLPVFDADRDREPLEGNDDDGEGDVLTERRKQNFRKPIK